MPLRAVSRPSHSVHGSPWTSPEVHWLHASLAHDWRTSVTHTPLDAALAPTNGARTAST
jgi:hypothetical protein